MRAHTIYAKVFERKFTEPRVIATLSKAKGKQSRIFYMDCFVADSPRNDVVGSLMRGEKYPWHLQQAFTSARKR